MTLRIFGFLLLLICCFQLQAVEVLRYNFNNSNADDTSGQNNHGSILGNGCAFTDARDGKVLSLDKTTTCWVSMPSDLIRTNPQFTVSMWFKTTSSGGLLGYSSANVNQRGNQFVPVLSVRTDGKLYAEMWIGSSMTVISNDVVNDGQWHQAVLTSNNTSIRLYLDGVDIGGAIGNPQHLSMTFNYVGTNDSRGRALQTNGWNFFSGQIDDVSFRTDALSADDIAIPKYTIVYDGNGATGGAAPVNGSKLKDVPFTLSDAGSLVKTNYIFTGWNTAADGSGSAYSAGAIYQLNTPLTLYAQWQLALVNLSFDSAGGTAVPTITQVVGSQLTAPANPTRVGYNFFTWDPAFPAIMPAQDLVLTARWQLAQYKLSIDSNGGSTIEPMLVTYTSPVQVTTPVRVGYTFTGWIPDVPATMPAEDLTLQAQWQVNQYQLNFNTAGGQSIASRTVNYGSTLSLPVPEREGYAFKGWSPAAPGTMPAQNLTFTATWEADSAKVTTAGGSFGVFSVFGLIVLGLLRRISKVLLLAIPFVAQAQPAYIGVQVGNAKSQSSDNLGVAVRDKMQQRGITGTATEISNSDASYRLFSGFKINEWLFAEVGWLDLGNAEIAYDNFTPQSERRLLEVQPQRGRGLEASLLAEFQFNELIYPYVRVAVFHSQNSYLIEGPEQQQKVEQRSLRPGVEFGAYYRINPQVDIGISASHYKTENFSTRQWSLGVKYHF